MIPNQPSGKAREVSYAKMIKLFNWLKIFGIINWDDEKDHMMWKNFVMNHTPMDKRGGPKRGVK